MKKLILFLMAIAATLCFASCDFEDDDGVKIVEIETNSFITSFDFPSTYEVKAGTKVEIPVTNIKYNNNKTYKESMSFNVFYSGGGMSLLPALYDYDKNVVIVNATDFKAGGKCYVTLYTNEYSLKKECTITVVD